MENVMEAAWKVLAAVTGSLFFWNMIFAIIIVFFERRDPKSVWAWLLLLFFLPGAGFIFYLFLGGDMRKRRMFRAKELEEDLGQMLRYQQDQIRSRPPEEQEDIAGYMEIGRAHV